jgi:hypothetical protein
MISMSLSLSTLATADDGVVVWALFEVEEYSHSVELDDKEGPSRFCQILLYPQNKDPSSLTSKDGEEHTGSRVAMRNGSASCSPNPSGSLISPCLLQGHPPASDKSEIMGFDEESPAV